MRDITCPIGTHGSRVSQCRLTPFALPWAMDSLGFQPVSPLRTNRELVENKWEIIEIVSKVRVSSEERGERSPCGVGSAPKGQ